MFKRNLQSFFGHIWLNFVVIFVEFCALAPFLLLEGVKSSGKQSSVHLHP